MAFDADAYVKALEKPSIRIGGETHEGKLLSFNQAIAFAERFDGMSGEDVPVSQVRELAERVFTQVYDEEVTAQILELPPGGVLEALDDFFGYQFPDGKENGEKET